MVFAPEGTPLEKLAKGAGSRWRVESKGEVRLAHYEVRIWHGWYRHITQALFAHALLAALQAAGRCNRRKKGLKKVPATSRSRSSRDSEDSGGTVGE